MNDLQHNIVWELIYSITRQWILAIKNDAKDVPNFHGHRYFQPCSLCNPLFWWIIVHIKAKYKRTQVCIESTCDRLDNHWAAQDIGAHSKAMCYPEMPMNEQRSGVASREITCWHQVSRSCIFAVGPLRPMPPNDPRPRTTQPWCSLITCICYSMLQHVYMQSYILYHV